jgi:hypothetical protein
VNDLSIEVGDLFLLRCKPSAADGTWSENDRIVAHVVYIQGDLIAVECSDAAFHEEGTSARVLHRRALESCLLSRIHYPNNEKV